MSLEERLRIYGYRESWQDCPFCNSGPVCKVLPDCELCENCGQNPRNHPNYPFFF